MSTTFKSKLQEALNRIQVNDTRLNNELKRIRSTTASKEKARSLSPALEGLGNSLEVIDSGFALETIVLRTGRPVLAISMDEAVLEFRDAESEVWRSRLVKNKSLLKSAIRAVGRIELQHHATFSWVGTGWLVTPDIVVTNRHVAEVFAEHQGKNFVFKSGLGGKRVEAAIDFLEEHGRSQAHSFELTNFLYIEPSPGPDLAFIKVKSSGSSFPKPIKLAAKQAALKQDVVVIGYPARDSRIPDQQLMLDIFGDVYDKKRLAPGQVIGSTSSELKHDCSTLGGSMIGGRQ